MGDFRAQGDSVAGSDFRVNNFDLVRLFAASQVMLFHCAAHFDLYVPFPLSLLAHFPGVPIFFITSGLLVSASYDRTLTTRDFYVKRALRLFPALWVCIVVTGITVAAFGYPVLTGRGLVWAVAQMGGLIYTPDFLRSLGFGSYNGSLWTIPLEIQFYLTIPLLAWIVRRRRGGALLVSLFVVFFAAAIILREVFPTIREYAANERVVGKLLRYSFIPHYFLFLAGVVVFHFKLWNHWIFSGKALPWIAAVILFSFVSNGSAVSSVMDMSLAAGFTMAFAYTRISWRDVLHGHDLSYGVYIYHGLMMMVMFQLGFVKGWGPTLVVIVATFGLAALSWRFVERPALDLKRQFDKRRPRAVNRPRPLVDPA